MNNLVTSRFFCTNHRLLSLAFPFEHLDLHGLVSTYFQALHLLKLVGGPSTAVAPFATFALHGITVKLKIQCKVQQNKNGK